MNEIYTLGEEKTPTTVIMPDAQKAAEPYVAELLQISPFVDVTGIPLTDEDPLSVHSNNPVQNLPVMAMSLRWVEQEGSPDDLEAGYPLLRCYDMSRHSYIGFIALPDFGFSIQRTSPVILSDQERYSRLPSCLKPYSKWQPKKS